MTTNPTPDPKSDPAIAQEAASKIRDEVLRYSGPGRFITIQAAANHVEEVIEGALQQSRAATGATDDWEAKYNAEHELRMKYQSAFDALVGPAVDQELAPPTQPESDPAVEAAKEIHAANSRWLDDRATLNEPTLTAIIRRHIDAHYVPASELAALRDELNRTRENLYAGIDRDVDNTTTPHLATVAVNALHTARSDLARVTEERDALTKSRDAWRLAQCTIAETSHETIEDLRAQLASAQKVVEAKDAALKDGIRQLRFEEHAPEIVATKLTTALALTLSVPMQVTTGKQFVFQVEFAGDMSAGLWPYSQTVTVCFATDRVGLEAEGIEIFTDALKEYFDGANVSCVDSAQADGKEGAR